MFRSSRRRNLQAVVIALVVIVGLLLLWPPSPVLPDGDASSGGVPHRAAAQAASGADRSADTGGEAADSPADVLRSATPVFARRGGLDLHLPADTPRLVAYHEAARPAALAVHPVGRMLANDNPTKFSPPRGGDGPEYVVLSSRGRAHPASSATDVVLEPDVPVRSPVSGRVVEVRPYLLYGQHADTRIEIAPEGHPDVRIVLIHVEDPQVRVGEQVEAGRTVLAGGAVTFPFSSHVDRFLEPERLPHVHLELKSLESE